MPRLERLPPAALLVLLAAAVACAPSERAQLLLVTVDTLRADHLGAWGDREAETPCLDALAAESLVFERAWTPIPITAPSLASVLTGRYPRNHGVLNNAYDLGDAPHLAELLRAAGYRTAAFLPTFLGDKPGFRRGFERYDCPVLGEDARSADELVAAALAWLRAAEGEGASWFAWIHLVEPHSPYAPGARWEREHLPSAWLPVRAELRREAFDAPLARTRDEVELVRALYRGEVEAVDRALCPLVELARTRASTERELVLVFTADHGEMLYEHERYIGHTAFLYEQMLRVPLLVHSSRRGGARSAFPASLLDVAPTLLAAAGVGCASPDGGVDLRAAPREAPERLLVHESFAPEGWCDQQALRRGAHKLVRAAPARPARLLDLAVDPSEARALGEGEPRARELEAAFGAWAQVQRDPAAARAPALDGAWRAGLEALGYVQGERGEH